MSYEVREMTLADYEGAIALWQQTEGVVLSAADSQAAIGDYLQRNPGMSVVCVDQARIIGTILCGHDGRRGYLYHAAVDTDYRKQGIAKAMASACLERLQQAGIERCHLMVLDDNHVGQAFWHQVGWKRRNDILLYSSPDLQ